MSRAGVSISSTRHPDVHVFSPATPIPVPFPAFFSTLPGLSDASIRSVGLVQSRPSGETLSRPYQPSSRKARHGEAQLFAIFRGSAVSLALETPALVRLTRQCEKERICVAKNSGKKFSLPSLSNEGMSPPRMPTFLSTDPPDQLILPDRGTARCSSTCSSTCPTPVAMSSASSSLTASLRSPSEASSTFSSVMCSLGATFLDPRYHGVDHEALQRDLGDVRPVLVGVCAGREIRPLTGTQS